MERTSISWLVGLTGLAFWMFPSAAAELSPLNCSVTRLPNGAFRYQLSEASTPSSCSVCWEDHNKVVIARDSLFNTTLVEKLTDDYIDMKKCRHLLRHRTDCFLSQRDVDCRVNCSLFEPRDLTPHTRLCLSESLCFDWWTGALVLGLLAAAFVLVLIVSFGVYKRRRRRSPYAAAPATDIKMESFEEPPAKNPQ